MDRKEFLNKLDHFVNVVLNNVMEKKEQVVKEQNRQAQMRYTAKQEKDTPPLRYKRR